MTHHTQTDFEQAHNLYENCELYQITFENRDNQEIKQIVVIDLCRDDDFNANSISEWAEDSNFNIQDNRKVMDPAWIYLVEFAKNQQQNDTIDSDLILSFRELTFDELQNKHPDRVIEHVEIFKNRFHESK
jgi:hypothetical protein